MTNIDKWQFTPDKPFFVYDPDGDGMSFFSTKKDRNKFAKSRIKDYLNEEFMEDCAESVIAGTITHEFNELSALKPLGKSKRNIATTTN